MDEVDAAVEAIRNATATFIDPHFIRGTADRPEARRRDDVGSLLALLLGGLKAGAL